MTEAPDITILLPVYNGERHLRDCIDSVLSQTHPSFELIIGDDCSTDSSISIIERYDDKRIKLIKNQENMRLFENMNTLIPLISSPLVRFLGQDDLLKAFCLERELDFFNNHPEINMSYCKARFVNDIGTETGASPLHDLPELLSAEDATQLFFFLGSLPGNISTVCLRKKVFDLVGLFDVSYGVAADYEMWTRICRNASLGVIHQYLLELRLHERQLSRQVKSVAENTVATRRVMFSLLPIIQGRFRWTARRYLYLRKDVMDAHIAYRLLQWRSFASFSRVVQAMGPMHFVLGSLIWLITLNNRLYRPSHPPV